MNNDEKHALVIGLGMGKQYVEWLQSMGYVVTTLDADCTKLPDYTNINDVPRIQYDIAYVGTPNFTHEEYARILGGWADLVLVEKPGVESYDRWEEIIRDYSSTRYYMVKNNLFRWESDELHRLRTLADESDVVEFEWVTRNRIPSPGSWFTNKSKSYGGVSRDIFPHTFCMMAALFPNVSDFSGYGNGAWQNHSLDTVHDTEYGTVYPDGVYDVDDMCRAFFEVRNYQYVSHEIQWKTGMFDAIGIKFKQGGNLVHYEKLRLCPKEAYVRMIETCVSKMQDESFWLEQLAFDKMLYREMEKFNK